MQEVVVSIGQGVDPVDFCCVHQSRSHVACGGELDWWLATWADSLLEMGFNGHHGACPVLARTCVWHVRTGTTVCESSDGTSTYG